MSQTTFTIEEIYNWLNSLDPFEEVRSTFSNLSAEDIIKANTPMHDPDAEVPIPYSFTITKEDLDKSDKVYPDGPLKGYEMGKFYDHEFKHSHSKYLTKDEMNAHLDEVIKTVEDYKKAKDNDPWQPSPYNGL